MSVYGCLKPVQLPDRKKPGKIQYVPCRECHYCLAARRLQLRSMVEREMQNKKNKHSFFIDLDYDNEHLPVYEWNEKELLWISNRSEVLNHDKTDYVYKSIDIKDDQDFTFDYYVPTNYKHDKAFGHLCYYDIKEWFANIKHKISNDIKTKKKYCDNFEKLEDKIYSDFDYLFDCLNDHDEKDIKERLKLEKKRDKKLAKLKIQYEKYKKIPFNDYSETAFRYFVCGEYGPVTFRPHYHVLFWFEREYTSEQLSYLFEVFRTSWENGRFDINTVQTEGAPAYVANYLTGNSDLPTVLRKKPLKPFCVYSKNPLIGSIDVLQNQIEEYLAYRVVKFRKWDDEKKQVIDVLPPSSYMRRNFPKCVGFNIKDIDEQLFVYSYVYEYIKRNEEKFKDYKLTNFDDFKKIKLKDIEFPEFIYQNIDSKTKLEIKDNGVIHRYLQSVDIIPKYKAKYSFFSYEDKRASLICAMYCFVFGYKPIDVLYIFHQIYSRYELFSLKEFYMEQDASIKNNVSIDYIDNNNYKDSYVQ